MAMSFRLQLVSPANFRPTQGFIPFFWWISSKNYRPEYSNIFHFAGGKLIASVTSISGVLVLAFPITMIVEKFGIAYDTTNHNAVPTFSQLAQPRRRRRKFWNLNFKVKITERFQMMKLNSILEFIQLKYRWFSTWKHQILIVGETRQGLTRADNWNANNWSPIAIGDRAHGWLCMLWLLALLS